MVVKDLDIFDRVGHSTAHDEIIPIGIKKGKLSVQGEVSTFTGKLNIEFVKVRKVHCSQMASLSLSLTRCRLGRFTHSLYIAKPPGPTIPRRMLRQEQV